MAMENIRALIDQVTRRTADERQQLVSSTAPARNAERLLGLRFMSGQRVIDLVTGARATVERGDRDERDSLERYRVRLDDGTARFRTRDELEPVPAPPAPAAK